MSKNNDSKVSISALDKLLSNADNEARTIIVSCGEGTLELKVKRDVSLQEYCNMVNEAAETCFQLNNDGEEYYAAGIEEFARDYVLLEHLTNLKNATDVQKTERQNDRLYDLWLNTDVMDRVREALPDRYHDDFIDAVWRQVEFRKQQMLSNERQKLIAAANQFEKISDSFKTFMESFGDIDPAALMEMLQKVASMDSVELGEAVVNSRDKDFVEQRKAKITEMPNVKS